MSNPQFQSPPEAPSAWKLFWSTSFPGQRWPGAVRVVISFIIPATLALMLGHPHVMTLVAMGAFTVIYGEGHPYRRRASVMATAAILLTISTVIGNSVGHIAMHHGGLQWSRSFTPDQWLSSEFAYSVLPIVALALVAMMVVFTVIALRIGPPGGFFFIMVTGATMSAAHNGITPQEVLIATLAGSITAWLVGMSGLIWDPEGPQRRAVAAAIKAVDSYIAAQDTEHAHTAGSHAVSQLRLAWIALQDCGAIRAGRLRRTSDAQRVQQLLTAQRTWLSAQANAHDIHADSFVDRIPLARPTGWYRWWQAVGISSHAGTVATRIAIASLLSGTASVIFGWGRPDWAIISAVLILQGGTDRINGTVRGIHRLVGSICGVLIFALIYILHPEPWMLIIILAFCLLWVEIMVVRNYGLSVLVATPLALLMGGSEYLPLGEVVNARILEVAVAVALAIASIWLVLPRRALSLPARTSDSISHAGLSLIDRLRSHPVDQSLEHRCVLRWQLAEDSLAAVAAITQWPQAGQRAWQHHLDIQAAGEALLAACAATEGHISANTLNELEQRFVALTPDLNPTGSH